MKIYRSKIIGEMQALMEEVTRAELEAQGMSGKKERKKERKKQTRNHVF